MGLSLGSEAGSPPGLARVAGVAGRDLGPPAPGSRARPQPPGWPNQDRQLMSGPPAAPGSSPGGVAEIPGDRVRAGAGDDGVEVVDRDVGPLVVVHADRAEWVGEALDEAQGAGPGSALGADRAAGGAVEGGRHGRGAVAAPVEPVEAAILDVVILIPPESRVVDEAGVVPVVAVLVVGQVRHDRDEPRDQAAPPGAVGDLGLGDLPSRDQRGGEAQEQPPGQAPARARGGSRQLASHRNLLSARLPPKPPAQPPCLPSPWPRYTGGRATRAARSLASFGAGPLRRVPRVAGRPGPSLLPTPGHGWTSHPGHPAGRATSNGSPS